MYNVSTLSDMLISELRNTTGSQALCGVEA